MIKKFLITGSLLGIFATSTLINEVLADETFGKKVEHVQIIKWAPINTHAAPPEELSTAFCSALILLASAQSLFFSP